MRGQPSARTTACWHSCHELYREQIDRGLGGDPAGATKARTIPREMLGEITLSPGEDGSLWAEYAMQPAALLKDAREQVVGVRRFGVFLQFPSVFA